MQQTIQDLWDIGISFPYTSKIKQLHVVEHINTEKELYVFVKYGDHNHLVRVELLCCDAYCCSSNMFSTTKIGRNQKRFYAILAKLDYRVWSDFDELVKKLEQAWHNYKFNNKFESKVLND